MGTTWKLLKCRFVFCVFCVCVCVCVFVCLCARLSVRLPACLSLSVLFAWRIARIVELVQAMQVKAVATPNKLNHQWPCAVCFKCDTLRADVVIACAFQLQHPSRRRVSGPNSTTWDLGLYLHPPVLSASVLDPCDRLHCLSAASCNSRSARPPRTYYS